MAAAAAATPLLLACRAPLDAAWAGQAFSAADVAAGAPLRRAADMALRDACRQLVFAQPLDDGER